MKKIIFGIIALLFAIIEFILSYKTSSIFALIGGLAWIYVAVTILFNKNVITI